MEDSDSIYIKLHFDCGHKRNTRSEFEARELKNRNLWIKTSGICDICKSVKMIVDISEGSN